MDIKYLEEIPLNASLIRDKDSAVNMLAYKSYLNLGFNSVNSADRLSNLQDIHRVELDYQSESSLYSLLLTLESYICTLLWVPSFLSMDRSEVTEHYRRRQIKVNSSKILPSEDYAREIMFASIKTWGTQYGSLGYFIHMNEGIEEYMSPSQMVDLSVKSMIYQAMNASKGRGYEDQISDVYNSILNSISNDDIREDSSIYKGHSSLILRTSLIREGYKQVSFLESWAPQLLSWYLKKYKEEGSTEAPLMPSRENELNAYKTLIDISKLLLSYGLDDNCFSNLSYSFIHQTIPPIFYSLMEEMIYLRRATLYTDTELGNTEVESLASALVRNISINERPTSIREASQAILESIAPPGGFNLLLISLAASLLNRAYILTHTHMATNLSVNIDLVSLEDRGRIYRLIYMASRLLRKSNLEHLISVGENIQLLSGLEDTRNNFKEGILNDNY